MVRAPVSRTRRTRINIMMWAESGWGQRSANHAFRINIRTWIWIVRCKLKVCIALEWIFDGLKSPLRYGCLFLSSSICQCQVGRSPNIRNYRWTHFRLLSPLSSALSSAHDGRAESPIVTGISQLELILLYNSFFECIQTYIHCGTRTSASLTVFSEI